MTLTSHHLWQDQGVQTFRMLLIIPIPAGKVGVFACHAAILDGISAFLPRRLAPTLIAKPKSFELQ